MAHFKIEGLRPYDGEHPIEFDNLTNRELHLIKEISGVRAAELQESFAAGDNDLVVAFAIIALQRSQGRVLASQEQDLIWDAPAGAITFVVDEEDDADPPENSPPIEGGANEISSGPHEHSGQPGSNGGGAHLATVPSPTGSQPSVIGSA